MDIDSWNYRLWESYYGEDDTWFLKNWNACPECECHNITDQVIDTTHDKCTCLTCNITWIRVHPKGEPH